MRPTLQASSLDDLSAGLEPQPMIELVHTTVGEDAHRIDALHDIGAPERLDLGAEQLAGRVDAVVWACTSGSFVRGWGGARQQADAIGTRPAAEVGRQFSDA